MTKKNVGFFNSRLVIVTCRSPRGRAGAFPLPTTLSATFPSPSLPPATTILPLLPLPSPRKTGGRAGKGDGEVAGEGIAEEGI